MISCPHNPQGTFGPIGMYHCPDCGIMVLAGLPHPTDEQCREQLPDWQPPWLQRLKAMIDTAQSQFDAGMRPGKQHDAFWNAWLSTWLIELRSIVDDSEKAIDRG